MSKIAAKGLPGSDKILKDFKKTGPNTAKVPQNPKEDPKFSQGTEKKKKTLKENINNSTTMDNKFDKLFEDVMNDDDLQELGINDSPTDDLNPSDDFGGEDEIGGGTPVDKLKDLIVQLQGIVDELGGGDDGMGEEGDLGGDEFGTDEFGAEPEPAIKEEVEAEYKGHPLVNQKKSELDNPKGSNKVNAPGYKATGTGKADTGKIPEQQADPKAHSEAGGQALTKNGNNKPNSKIKGGGKSLFEH